MVHSSSIVLSREYWRIKWVVWWFHSWVNTKVVLWVTAILCFFFQHRFSKESASFWKRLMLLYPRCSMYGLFNYIWIVLGGRVGKYTIAWAFGYVFIKVGEFGAYSKSADLCFRRGFFCDPVPGPFYHLATAIHWYFVCHQLSNGHLDRPERVPGWRCFRVMPPQIKLMFFMVSDWRRTCMFVVDFFKFCLSQEPLFFGVSESYIFFFGTR